MNHALAEPGKKSRASVVLVWLIGFCMLFSLERLFNDPVSQYVYTWVLTAQLILFGAVLFRLRLKGNAWYWIPAAGFVWLFLSTALESDRALKYMDLFMLRAVLVYLLCPAVGLLAAEGDLKRFLKVYIAIWTLCYTALVVVGICYVFRGTYITDASGQYILGLRANYLILLDSQQNQSSTNLVFSIMMAAVGFTLYRSRAAKAAMILAMIPMFLGIAMTGSRSGEAALGVGFGFLLMIPLQKGLSGKLRAAWLRLAVSAVLVLAVTAVTIAVFLGTQKLLNRAISRYSAAGLFPSARAEEMIPGTEEMIPGEEVEPLPAAPAPGSENNTASIREREFLESNFLNGRLTIWGQAWEAIQRDPVFLLRGRSVPLWRDIVNGMGIYFWAYHCHNILIQFVMEAGLPALLLCLIYLFFVIRAAVRLFLDYDRPLWQRFLILPVVTIAVIETVEAIFRIRAQAFANQTFMLFSGLMLALTAVRKNPDDGRPEEQIP